ncbi:MAG: glucosamine-6-phosphate deaminase [Clostridia bacterium]|nr:glucosamine-6-phosphate deaminase [Clostridia bacterium]
MTPIKTIKTDLLTTEVYADRPTMGRAAAARAIACIKQVIAERGYANVVFAAAPSQNEMLEALIDSDLDFTKINAFHMDEYVGLPKTHPQSFGAYLTEHIFARAPFRSVHIMNTMQSVEDACREYTALLEEYPTDVVCMGIGENGHIAFNDPPVADFGDKAAIKKVELDDVCRMQQVHDGCFPDFDSVPKYALTLTVPALMRAKYLVCTVPASTKAEAVSRTLNWEISEACPATAMRRHPDAVMFLDTDSAEKIL